MALINRTYDMYNKETVDLSNIINEISDIIEKSLFGDADLSTITAKEEDIAYGTTFYDPETKLIKIGTGIFIEESDEETFFKNFIEGTSRFLEIPEDATSIVDYAFINKTNLILINLPSSLTSISTYAFYNCTNLALTELPSGITSIGQYAFYNCTNLALTELPSSLTSIENYAFYNCTNLASIELSSGITNISYYAFGNCTNLKTMKIKCQQLGTGLRIFENCSNLTKVWISSNCTTITALSASSAQFVGCPDTLEIYTDATEKLSGWGDYFNRTSSNGSIEAVVHYGVSEAEFDAIIIEGGEA